jgi:hypothetical protein
MTKIAIEEGGWVVGKQTRIGKGSQSSRIITKKKMIRCREEGDKQD